MTKDRLTALFFAFREKQVAVEIKVSEHCKNVIMSKDEVGCFSCFSKALSGVSRLWSQQRRVGFKVDDIPDKHCYLPSGGM